MLLDLPAGPHRHLLAPTAHGLLVLDAGPPSKVAPRSQKTSGWLSGPARRASSGPSGKHSKRRPDPASTAGRCPSRAMITRSWTLPLGSGCHPTPTPTRSGPRSPARCASCTPISSAPTETLVRRWPLSSRPATISWPVPRRCRAPNWARRVRPAPRRSRHATGLGLPEETAPTSPLLNRRPRTVAVPDLGDD